MSDGLIVIVVFCVIFLAFFLFRESKERAEDEAKGIEGGWISGEAKRILIPLLISASVLLLALLVKASLRWVAYSVGF